MCADKHGVTSIRVHPAVEVPVESRVVSVARVVNVELLLVVAGLLPLVKDGVNNTPVHAFVNVFNVCDTTVRGVLDAPDIAFTFRAFYIVPNFEGADFVAVSATEGGCCFGADFPNLGVGGTTTHNLVKVVGELGDTGTVLGDDKFTGSTHYGLYRVPVHQSNLHDVLNGVEGFNLFTRVFGLE